MFKRTIFTSCQRSCEQFPNECVCVENKQIKERKNNSIILTKNKTKQTRTEGILPTTFWYTKIFHKK